ncbi:MAG: hypothetical protein BGN86_03230 [Caulobacterales bacterium 68-7]|nr:MAG: hypothetical protein BGN86_03230 [Caulobacterales bacterium 68-7]
MITNPNAAQNPEGSGGIINLVMKQSRGGGWTGSTYGVIGGGGLKRAGGSFGYNSKKLSVTGNLASSYQRAWSEAENVRTLPDPLTGGLAKHDLILTGRNLNRSQNGGLTIGYDLTPKDRVTGAITYNQMLLYGYPTNTFEDYDASGALISFQNRTNARRFTTRDTGFTSGWKHSFAGDGHTLSVDLIANRSRYDDANLWSITRSSPAIQPLERNDMFADLAHSEFRTTYVRPDVQGGKLTLGYELKYDDQGYDAVVARGATVPGLVTLPSATYEIDYEQTINAAYGTFERPFGDVTVIGGLRLENADIKVDERTTSVDGAQDYFRAFPSLNVSWKMDDQSKLAFSYSERIQRPPPFILTPFRVYIDPKNYQEGNPRLRPQETQSFEVSYEKRRNGALYLATLYYRSNEGEFSPVARNQGDGVVLVTFDNLGSSRSAGLELVANGKLAKNLTYNATANLFRNEIDASNLGLGAGTRTANGIGGRFNLNWQATPEDALQLNLAATGKRLFAQGTQDPIYTVNAGWRHKLTDRATATLSVQDMFRTNRFRREFNTPAYTDWAESRPVARTVLLRIDYRLGGGNAKAPAAAPQFEYGGGGGGGAGGL